jgi:hypothetical protein
LTTTSKKTCGICWSAVRQTLRKRRSGNTANAGEASLARAAGEAAHTLGVPALMSPSCREERESEQGVRIVESPVTLAI